MVVGCFCMAMSELGATFPDPAQLGEDPAAQVHREALAGFLATKAAAQHCRLADFLILIGGTAPAHSPRFAKAAFARALFRTSPSVSTSSSWDWAVELQPSCTRLVWS